MFISNQVGGIVGGVIGGILLLTLIICVLATRYKKCPSDKIMVIYGSVGKSKEGTGRSAKCIHGGAAFVWPFIQGYKYMDLTPISMSVDLKSALSRQNIRIDVPSRFTVGISTEPGVMQNAAERLLRLNLNDIQELSRDIIFGQMRLIIATMDIEEINTNREKFLEQVSINVESELKKIGLRLINVNVTDITDESGYIDALGKEATAKAVNDAKRSVAEKNRDGSSGAAVAFRDQRIQVAQADALAVAGENSAKGEVSRSSAELRKIQAEAERDAQVAEFVAQAYANEEAYKAEQRAEIERAKRERATREADIIVAAQIKKQEIEIAADAEAERIRRQAKGEADAIILKRQAEAKGYMEVLTKQAEGFAQIIKAAGGSADGAVKLMLSDKMEQLVKLQVEAIKNIKIDKVTVWDTMNGKDGSSTTSNFLSSMYNSVPPLTDMFKMCGMDMPDYLGKVQKDGLEELSAPTTKGKGSK